MAGEDDDIYPDRDDDESEEAAIIRRALEGLDGDDSDDDGGFDQPPVERESDVPDVVSAKQGHEMVGEAEAAREKASVSLDEHGAKERDRKGVKGDAADTAPADAADGVDRDGGDDTTAQDDAAAKADGEDSGDDADKGTADLESSDISALLDGVPDDRKSEITRRLDGADRIMRRFDSHSEELKMHGLQPEQALDRLLELNAFAQTKPAEYLAWVTKEVGNEKALEGAAELLGYKLVKADEGAGEDDPFEDEATKKLREENAELKRRLQGDAPAFGPDAPQYQSQRQAMATLESVKYERDPETGALVRPHFEKLEPIIQRLAQQRVQQEQRHLTGDDLKSIYDDAVRTLGIGQAAPAGQAATPAAQGGASVQQQINEKAAQAQRARKASKNVDGSGQGATRRPALPEGASIEETIRHYAAQQE